MNDQQQSRADALTDAAALAMYEKASIAASEFDSVEAAHVAFVRSILAASPVARPAAAPSDNAHLLVALDMHRAEQKVPLSDVSPTSLDDLYSKAEPDSEILKLVEQYGCALLKQRTDEATAILEQIRTLATSANETGAEGANSRPIYVSADNLRLYEAGLYSMFDVGVETPDRTIRLYTAPPAMAAAAPADEREAFEKVFPMPADCQRIGRGRTAGYAPTEYGAWEARAFIRRWEGWKARAAVSPAGSIPAGWKLVPIEPTESMVVEGFESWPDQFFSDPEVWAAYEKMTGCQQAAHKARLCYAAMLAAAPQPAQADARAEAREPAAWVTPEGDRALTQTQKQGMLRDGGASASSVRPYSIPCYAGSAPADAGEAREPVTYDDVVSACEAHGIPLPVEAIEETVALINHFSAPTAASVARLTDEERSTIESLARTSTPYEREVLRALLDRDAGGAA